MAGIFSLSPFLRSPIPTWGQGPLLGGREELPVITCHKSQDHVGVRRRASRAQALSHWLGSAQGRDKRALGQGPSIHCPPEVLTDPLLLVCLVRDPWEWSRVFPRGMGNMAGAGGRALGVGRG